MSAVALSDRDKAAIGIVVAALGAKLFSESARRLGWTPIMVAIALYLAGRIAKQW